MTVYKAGTTPYYNPTVNISSSSTAPPALVAGATSYEYFSGAAGSIGEHTWQLSGDSAWQFRRLVYAGSAAATDVDLIALRTGADAGNALIVRIQGTDKMRVVANGGAFPFTSLSTFPHDALYRLEGYGDGVAGTAHIALFAWDGTAPLANHEYDGAVAQGGVAPTFVRFGKCSGASTYTGKLAWALDEFYTGADAKTTFLGPYGSNLAPVADFTSAFSGAMMLTSTSTDSDGSIVSVLWDVTAWPSGASDPVVINPTSPDALFLYSVPGDYTVSLTVTDDDGAQTVKTKTVTAQNPGSTSTAPRYRFYYDSTLDAFI